MHLQITDHAVACLKDEWGFHSGEFVRVYIRYVSGGAEALSLGIQKDKPKQAVISCEAGGILFFVEESDEWYLQDRSITIDAEGTEILFAADLL